MDLRIGNEKLIYYSGRATGKKSTLIKLAKLEKEMSKLKGDDISNLKSFK